jgi:ADP-ribose pyrophosphatase
MARHYARKPMTTKDVRVLKKTHAFRGYFGVNRYYLSHRLFQGGWSPPIKREVFERGHAVGVLLYDPSRDVVVLIEQFRIGAFAALPALRFRRRPSPWLMEIVAGIVEKGERPETVARREALEEAGCEILDLVHVRDYLVTPGGSTESVIVYCGRVRAPRHGSIHGIATEHEDIRVHVVPSARALQWLDTGVACNSMIIIALQWFRENRAKLRRRWTPKRRRA